ncbi:MAG: PKD domain-containing protein [Bacteroidota bacterium]
MKRLIAIVGCIICLGVGSSIKATHIVGAELFYECTDSTTHTYTLTLKLYRDCINGVAGFDPIINLFVFNPVTGIRDTVVQAFAPANTPEIQPNNWGPCVAVTPSICVEEGVYKTTVVLPPRSDGYDIAWARCCRNVAIDNLQTPLEEGITFLAHVPDSALAQCNNMPVFDQVPPVFLCANIPFIFDHSATDIDGDSLVYALTDPYTGLNFQGLGAGNPTVGGNPPSVDPAGNPMGPAPYNHVVFAPGYSFTDPFGSGNFIIDPNTGFINVTPFQTGIFVFSISVFEYRNGVLLSENRRDYQIHVLNCLPQGDPPVITHNLSGLTHSNDTVFVLAGDSMCYDVIIQDSIVSDSLVGFTVSAQFGNGQFFPPAATFTQSGINPINGQVCWEPPCEYEGQVIPLMLGAFDNGDCDNVGNALDTVWVSISAPPNDPPLVTPDYTGLTLDGDTIIVDALDSLCFSFAITDPNTGDVLNAVPISPIFSDPNNPPVFTPVGTNPVTGTICWVPGCNVAGQIVELTFAGVDNPMCMDPLSDTSTIYIKVEVPPNQLPGIITDLNGNLFSNDTIFVNALDNLCFNFTSNDPDIGDDLTFFTISPIFNGVGAPTVTTSGTNPLSGTICWTPACSYENQVVELVFGVFDPGVCANIGEALDTVYVSVSVPPNDPPQITHDLTGTTFSNDTVFVTALSNFCYTFISSDPNGADVLAAYTVSPIFTQAGGPTFSTTGFNPISGQICWTPGCDFKGQIIELIIGVGDDADCSSQADDLDTVYISIAAPANDPPLISPDFGNLLNSNDTVFVNAATPFCFDLLFEDINLGDTLTPFTVSPIFSASNAATFTYTGINPLQGQVCWTPMCDNEGEVIEVIVGVEDNGNCENILLGFDTVYIAINDPNTIAPIVDHDLSGLNAPGDTIYIEIGDNACYEFYIADQTPEAGVSYVHHFENMFGLTINQTSLTTTVRNDSILGVVCFSSDCSNGGTVYRSIITGIDDEICPPFQQASDTVFIKVNTAFMAWGGTDTSFCEGTGGVQLNVTPIGGTAPYYFTWYCDDPGNCGFSNANNNTQDPVVNPTANTIYSVQITDANGCTSEFDDVQVQVNKLPIADAGPDRYICEGSSGTSLHCTIVNASEAPGPYTYSWTPGDGLNFDDIVNPRAIPDSTTIYTVVVTSANGCSSLATTLDSLSSVIVTVRESPIAEAGPEWDICLGDSTHLLGFANKAGPEYDYIWTPASGVIDSSDQTPMASPDFTTTYFLVVWSNGCRSVADSTTIHVHTLPTVNVGLGYEICAGDSVRLNGIVSGDPLSTEYTLSWDPPLGLDHPHASKPMASPLVTTTYVLTAESNFGCGSEKDSASVSVEPAPVAYAGLDTFLCVGDTLWLEGNHSILGGPLPANQPIFYSWDPPDGLSELFIRDPYVVPTRTEIYTLTVQTGACAAEDEIQVDVLPLPKAIAQADTLTACEGDAVQLYGSGGAGSATYSWSPAIGLDHPQSSHPIATPDTSITYVLTVKEGVCSAETPLHLNIHPSPDVDFFSSLAEGCPELEVHFIENVEEPAAFIWDFGDGSPLSNESNPVHTYPVVGEYPVTLTATTAGGCSATETLLTVQVFESGQALFETFPLKDGILPLPGAEVQFTDQSQQAEAYFWDFGDGQVSTEKNPIHTYEQAGSYMVSLTIKDAGGCLDQYSYGPFEVAIPDVLIPNIFSPNEDGINDVFQVRYTGVETFMLEVFDRWGRRMYGPVNASSMAWDGRLSNGSEAHEGVYYYTVRIGDKSYTGHVTLLR